MPTHDVPTSEVIARTAGAITWLLGVAFAVVAYLSRGDEGLESIGNALTLVLIAAPAFVLSAVTLAALVMRLRRKDCGPAGPWLWILAGPPSLLGAYVLLLQIISWFEG